MTMNKFWTIKMQENNKKAELSIYGSIASDVWYEGDVTPKQLKKDLDAMGDIDELDIFINSDGGSAFAGSAIYSMLKRHKAKKTVYIDGLAASIASVIAMAGDKIYMPENALIMVHNAWTMSAGNSADFRKIADDLDKVNNSIMSVYRDKTGLEDEKIKELMNAETWLTAKEALDYGFIDGIEAEKQIAASLKGGKFIVNGQEMSLQRYKNAPKMLIDAGQEEELETMDTPDPPGESNIANESREALFLLQKIIELKKKKYEEVVKQ